MIIDVDLYGQIRRLHVQEGLSQRAIAKRLGISRNTVKKYYEGENVPWQRKEYKRDTTVVTEEIRSFIQSCIDQDEAENLPKQRHTARRIYHRLKQEKGFTGAESTIRKVVQEIRPKAKEAFMPLEFDPGEAAQVDWGEATVYFQEERVKVQLFCYRLCYSADIFVKAFYRQNQESFLEGHVNAFTHFGGIPGKVIFDNARVAVKEGFGVYAKPQAQYQALSAHYAFNMHFTNINSGNEKSLVENLVGWVRRNVLVPVPRINNIDELNRILLDACINYRNHKIQGRSQTVGEQSIIDCHYLNPLPAFVFDTSKCLSLRVGEDSLVQFDRNRYSVPVHLVGRQISVKAYGNHLECYHDGVMVAQHSRCYGRGETTFHLEHYIPLLEKKPRSVYHAKPVRHSEAAALLAWGQTFPGGAKDTVKLLKLSVTYGVDRLLAVKEKLPSGITPTIELVLSELMPLSPMVIPIKSDIPVRCLDLSLYDRKYQVMSS